MVCWGRRYNFYVRISFFYIITDEKFRFVNVRSQTKPIAYDRFYAFQL